MNIDKQLLGDLTAQAKESPRLRMNYDLRTSPADTSQRMLNALEPGTVLPVHRHRASTEVVVMLRGRGVQWLYDGEGKVVEKVLLAPVSADGDEACNAVGIPAMNVEKGQWHRLECLESGTVIVEFKDGPYEPISPADILSM